MVTELTGVIAFAVTPFEDDRSLAMGALGPYLEDLARHPLDAVVVGGAVGEVFTLAVDEYDEMIACAGDAVGGATSLVVGITAAHGLAEGRARKAAEAGASALLLHSPYGADWTPSTLVATARALADASGLPILVFSTRSRPLDEAHLEKCAAEDAVVGVKDETHDPASFARHAERFGSDLLMINGSAERFAWEYRRAGAVAMTSGIANLVPSATLALWEACRREDEAEATRLWREVLEPLDRIRSRTPSHHVSVLKAGLAGRGMMSPGVRPPLEPLDDREREELAGILDGLTEEVVAR